MDGTRFLTWGFLLLDRNLRQLCEHTNLLKALFPLFDLLFQLMILTYFDKNVFHDFCNDLSFCLQPAHSRKIVLVLSGPPRTAKSTIARCLQSMFGKCFYSVDKHIPKHAGTGSSPEKMAQNNAYILTINECAVIDASTVKGMTGGDGAHSRNHHDREVTLIRPRPLLLCVSNYNSVMILNGDTAFLDRLRNYRLKVQFEATNFKGILWYDIMAKAMPQHAMQETAISTVLFSLLTAILNKTMKNDDGSLIPMYRSSLIKTNGLNIMKKYMPSLKLLSDLRYNLDLTKKNNVSLSDLWIEIQNYLAANQPNSFSPVIFVDANSPMTTASSSSNKKNCVISTLQEAQNLIVSELGEYIIDKKYIFLTKGNIEEQLEKDNDDDFFSLIDFRISVTHNHDMLSRFVVKRLFHQACPELDEVNMNKLMMELCQYLQQQESTANTTPDRFPSMTIELKSRS